MSATSPTPASAGAAHPDAAAATAARCRAGRRWASSLPAASRSARRRSASAPARQLAVGRPDRRCSSCVGSTALVAASSRAAGRPRTGWPPRWSTSPSCSPLLPLVSLLWTVRQQGPRRSSTPSSSPTRCATSSASRRRHLPRDHRHPADHAGSPPSSPCPIGHADRRSTSSSTARARLARAITFFVDVMTGIPSIVAGLFAYALFVLIFGPGVRIRLRRRGRAVGPDDPGRGPLHRGDAQARAQRAARGVLRPRRPEVAHHPQGGAADGARAASSPASCSPIARVIGETAPLLLIAGFSRRRSTPTRSAGRMATLPVFIYYSVHAAGRARRQSGHRPRLGARPWC